MGMLDFFKSAPTKQTAVETGGLRDMYMQHIEQAAMQGAQPLPFPEFVKMMEMRKRQEQEQMMRNQMLQRGLLSPNQ